MSHSGPYLFPNIVKDFIIFQRQQNVKQGRIIEEVKTRFNREVTYQTVIRLWSKYQATGTT